MPVFSPENRFVALWVSKFRGLSENSSICLLAFAKLLSCGLGGVGFGSLLSFLVSVTSIFLGSFVVIFFFGCTLEVGPLGWLFLSSGIAFSDKRGTMVLRLLPEAGWVPMSNSKNPT